MTPTSSVRVCTYEELQGQAGLSRLLQSFIEPSKSDVAANRDRLVVLNLDLGGDAFMEAGIKENRIATLGPIVRIEELATEERCHMWQAGIDWATREGPVALQLFCDPSTNDRVLLAELGFPVTTEVVTLAWEGRDVTESLDGAIRQAAYEPEQPALIRMASRTLVDSLDIPESISLHRPEALLAEWVSAGSQVETVILVAEAEHEMVGLLVALIFKSPRPRDELRPNCQINYLGVAADHRRRGWGSRLLKQLLRLASEAQVEQVSVFTDQRNIPAIQMYEKAGFRADDLRMPIVFQRLSETP